MMERILEPELMEAEDQVLAYGNADFNAANSLFLTLLRSLLGPRPLGGRVLDLGCGPGDICLRIARQFPRAEVHGVDGSAPMLAFARQKLAAQPDLKRRLRFILGRLPGAVLPAPDYQALVSNSLLHHLPDPAVLWRALRAYGEPGAPVLVMDLLRPPTSAAAAKLVARYAATEPDVLQHDFYQSLRAAFTLEEVRAQLEACGLQDLDVRPVSDRHLAVTGFLD